MSTATIQAPVAQIADLKQRATVRTRGERRGEGIGCEVKRGEQPGGRWCGRWSEIDATAGQPWPSYRQTLTQGDEDLAGLGIQAQNFACCNCYFTYTTNNFTMFTLVT